MNQALIIQTDILLMQLCSNNFMGPKGCTTLAATLTALTNLVVLSIRSSLRPLLSTDFREGGNRWDGPFGMRQDV
jgi:hypothetical protein